MIPDTELDRLDALTKAATPGPWHFVLRKRCDSETRAMIGAVAPGHQIVTDCDRGTRPSNDAAFIAASRIALPALTAEVRRLKAAHAEMVKRNALLRDRPDLPLERTRAYEAFLDELIELRKVVAELRDKP